MFFGAHSGRNHGEPTLGISFATTVGPGNQRAVYRNTDELGNRGEIAKNKTWGQSLEAGSGIEPGGRNSRQGPKSASGVKNRERSLGSGLGVSVWNRRLRSELGGWAWNRSDRARGNRISEKTKVRATKPKQRDQNYGTIRRWNKGKMEQGGNGTRERIPKGTELGKARTRVTRPKQRGLRNGGFGKTHLK